MMVSIATAHPITVIRRCRVRFIALPSARLLAFRCKSLFISEIFYIRHARSDTAALLENQGC